MSETVEQVIKMLANASNYSEARQIVSDEFMAFVKEHLPGDYRYLKEKEDEYQAEK